MGDRLREHALHLLGNVSDFDTIAEVIKILERAGGARSVAGGYRPMSPASGGGGGFQEVFSRSFQISVANSSEPSSPQTARTFPSPHHTGEPGPPLRVGAGAGGGDLPSLMGDDDVAINNNSLSTGAAGCIPDMRNNADQHNNNNNSNSNPGSPEPMTMYLQQHHPPTTTSSPAATAATTLHMGGGGRRAAVSDAPMVNTSDIDNYVPPVIPKDPEDVAEVRRQVQACHLFSSLDADEQDVVVKAMDREEFSAGIDILKQGEPSVKNRFYVILSGTVSIIKSGKQVATLNEGQSFGELEMMYDTMEPCVATVHAVTHLVTYFLDRQTFKKIVLKATLEKRRTYLSMLQKVSFLQGMSDYDKATLADVLQRADFKPEEPIIKFGEKGAWMHIIVAGEVKVVGREMGKKVEIVRLYPGDPVGELEFLFNHSAVADVVAVTKVRTAKMSRKHFEMCMGPIADNLKLYITEGKYKHYMKNADKAVLGEISAAEQKLKRTKVAGMGGNVIASSSVDKHGEIVVLDDYTQIDAAGVPIHHAASSVAAAAAAASLGGDDPLQQHQEERNKFLYRFPLIAVHQQNAVIIGVREDGVILSWNDAAARLTNYSAEDTLGQSIFSLIKRHEDQGELHKMLEEAVRWAGNTEALFAQYTDRRLPQLRVVFSRRDGLTHSHVALTCVPGVVAQPKHIPEMLLLVGSEQKRLPPEKEHDYGDWLVEQMRALMAQTATSPTTATGLASSQRSQQNNYQPQARVSLLPGIAQEVSHLGAEAAAALAAAAAANANATNESSVVVNNNNINTSNSVLKADVEALLTEFETLRDRTRNLDRGALHAVNPRQLLGQVVSSLQHDAVDRNNTVTSNFAANVPQQLFCDTELLPEVCRHALHNCVKHVRDATIRINTEIVTDRAIEYLEIAFEDTGRKGIDPGELRAFHKPKPSSQYATSGLIKLKAAVARLGGTMLVESEPGHTIVRIRVQYLAVEDDVVSAEAAMMLETVNNNNNNSNFDGSPSMIMTHADATGTGESGDSASSGATTAASKNRTYTTLVAEEHAVSRNALCSLLWNRKHAVVPAHTPDDFMRLVEMCDIIVVDPDQRFVDSHGVDDIFAFLQRLERRKAIVLTGQNVSEEVRDAHRKAGFITLSKPYSPVQTIAAIKRAEQTVSRIKVEEEKVDAMRDTFNRTNRGEWSKGALLGRGAFGDVYEAIDVLTGGKMAVKMMKIKRTQDMSEQQSKQELINEIEVMCTLHHPNIIHYFYCEDVPEELRVNLFMEYAGGGTLDSKLAKVYKERKKGMTAAEMRPILVDIVEGVKYIHSRRVVHCDLKTQNVLFGSADGRAKIGDFGTARQLQREGMQLYKMMGTLQYMSPECMSPDAENKKGYSFPADIWSVGCIAMELATGQLPWSHLGQRGQNYALINYITSIPEEEQQCPDLSFMFDMVEPPVFEFISACLSLNPEKRPTAAQLLDFALLRNSGDDADMASALKSLQKAKLIHTLNQFVAFAELPEEKETKQQLALQQQQQQAQAEKDSNRNLRVTATDTLGGGGGGSSVNSGSKRGAAAAANRRKSIMERHGWDSSEDDLPTPQQGSGFFDSDDDKNGGGCRDDRKEMSPSQIAAAAARHEAKKIQQQQQQQQHGDDQQQQDEQKKEQKQPKPGGFFESDEDGQADESVSPSMLAHRAAQSEKSGLTGKATHEKSSGVLPKAFVSDAAGFFGASSEDDDGGSEDDDGNYVSHAQRAKQAAIVAEKSKIKLEAQQQQQQQEQKPASAPPKTTTLSPPIIAANGTKMPVTPPGEARPANASPARRNIVAATAVAGVNNTNNNKGAHQQQQHQHSNTNNDDDDGPDNNTAGNVASSAMAIHEKLMRLLAKIAPTVQLDDPLQRQYKASLPAEEHMASSGFADQRTRPFVPQVGDLLRSHAQQLDIILKELEKRGGEVEFVTSSPQTPTAPSNRVMM